MRARAWIVGSLFLITSVLIHVDQANPQGGIQIGKCLIQNIVGPGADLRVEQQIINCGQGADPRTALKVSYFCFLPNLADFSPALDTNRQDRDYLRLEHRARLRRTESKASKSPSALYHEDPSGYRRMLQVQTARCSAQRHARSRRNP